MSDSIFIGGGGETQNEAQRLLLNRANRHGIIAGATGTGKTVTLQILAEGFSNAGVPVFCADVKGDLSGLCVAGTHEHKLHEKLISRAEKIGFEDYGYAETPTIFWDVFGEKGHPVRATISEMGPLLLARLMDWPKRREAVSPSRSNMPMTTICSFWTSRICENCWSIWGKRKSGTRFQSNTEMSRPLRLARFSEIFWSCSAKALKISSGNLRLNCLI